MIFPKRQVNRHCAVLIHGISGNTFAFSGKLCTLSCCDCCHKFTFFIPVRSLIVLRCNIFRRSNLEHASFQTLLIDKCPIFIACQHFPGLIEFQPALGFLIRIGYRHGGMGIAVLVFPALIVICLAVDCHFNVFFRDVQTACTVRLINPVRAGFQLLHGHHFPGVIGDKLIDGFHLVSVTIGLLHQLLSLIRHTVNLICCASL